MEDANRTAVEVLGGWDAYLNAVEDAIDAYEEAEAALETVIGNGYTGRKMLDAYPAAVSPEAFSRAWSEAEQAVDTMDPKQYNGSKCLDWYDTLEEKAEEIAAELQDIYDESMAVSDDELWGNVFGLSSGHHIGEEV